MVCGSDQSTYETICSLNEESVRRGPPTSMIPQLSMRYWGPCKEGNKAQWIKIDQKISFLDFWDFSAEIEAQLGMQKLKNQGEMRVF